MGADQKSTEASWDDYETVSNAIGPDDNPPEGLIVHAAGEVDGKWQSVSVWESQEAYERFRDDRLFPAVRQTLGDSAIEAGRRRQIIRGEASGPAVAPVFSPGGSPRVPDRAGGSARRRARAGSMGGRRSGQRHVVHGRRVPPVRAVSAGRRRRAA